MMTVRGVFFFPPSPSQNPPSVTSNWDPAPFVSKPETATTTLLRSAKTAVVVALISLLTGL